MSAFPNRKAHWRAMLVLLAVSAPAAATIVIDGRAVKSRTGSTIERSMLASPSASGSSYAIARSHAWMNYERGNRARGGALVSAPLNGAWMASSASQASVRTNIARAQAYRLGDRE